MFSYHSRLREAHSQARVDPSSLKSEDLNELAVSKDPVDQKIACIYLHYSRDVESLTKFLGSAPLVSKFAIDCLVRLNDDRVLVGLDVCELRLWQIGRMLKRLHVKKRFMTIDAILLKISQKMERSRPSDTLPLPLFTLGSEAAARTTMPWPRWIDPLFLRKMCQKHPRLVLESLESIVALGRRDHGLVALVEEYVPRYLCRKLPNECLSLFEGLTSTKKSGYVYEVASFPLLCEALALSVPLEFATFVLNLKAGVPPRQVYKHLFKQIPSEVALQFLRARPGALKQDFSLLGCFDESTRRMLWREYHMTLRMECNMATPYQVLLYLPDDLRIAEARRQLALPSMATERTVLISLASQLPFDEGFPYLKLAIRDEDVNIRAEGHKALGILVKHNRDQLPLLLEWHTRCGFDQVLVRHQIFQALLEQPASRWTSEHMQTISTIFTQAWAAKDHNPELMNSMLALIVKLFFVGISEEARSSSISADDGNLGGASYFFRPGFEKVWEWIEPSKFEWKHQDSGYSFNEQVRRCPYRVLYMIKATKLGIVPVMETLNALRQLHVCSALMAKGGPQRDRCIEFILEHEDKLSKEQRFQLGTGLFHVPAMRAWFFSLAANSPDLLSERTASGIACRLHQQILDNYLDSCERPVRNTMLVGSYYHRWNRTQQVRYEQLIKTMIDNALIEREEEENKPPQQFAYGHIKGNLDWVAFWIKTLSQLRYTNGEYLQSLCDGHDIYKYANWQESYSLICLARYGSKTFDHWLIQNAITKEDPILAVNFQRHKENPEKPFPIDALPYLNALVVVLARSSVSDAFALYETLWNRWITSRRSSDTGKAAARIISAIQILPKCANVLTGALALIREMAVSEPNHFVRRAAITVMNSKWNHSMVLSALKSGSRFLAQRAVRVSGLKFISDEQLAEVMKAAAEILMEDYVRLKTETDTEGSVNFERETMINDRTVGYQSKTSMAHCLVSVCSTGKCKRLDFGDDGATAKALFDLAFERPNLVEKLVTEGMRFLSLESFVKLMSNVLHNATSIFLKVLSAVEQHALLPRGIFSQGMSQLYHEASRVPKLRYHSIKILATVVDPNVWTEVIDNLPNDERLYLLMVSDRIENFKGDQVGVATAIEQKFRDSTSDLKRYLAWIAFTKRPCPTWSMENISKSQSYRESHGFPVTLSACWFQRPPMVPEEFEELTTGMAHANFSFPCNWPSIFIS